MSSKNENAILDELDILNEESSEVFDFDEIEAKLQGQLEEEFAELEFLQEEKDKIGNPDALGKVILEEVWTQFGNQIGLDMTNETLIQEYNRLHPEESKYSEEIGDSIMKDQRYKDANKAMREQQKAGNLKDEYTGKDLKQNEKANLDHVVPRKELFENQRRRQANIDTADLANKDENLKATNESLNKSKKEKSNTEYIEYLKNNEEKLRKECESKKRKIDESSMSDVDKRLAKEKLDKRLDDKLSANSELLKKADQEARKAINKDIAVGVAKQTAKKAGKDALKAIAVSALFSLLKEVMNGFVRFLKSQAKSFKSFLEEMKQALKSFFDKITNVLQAGASTAIGTIFSEIFGPIVSTFKKLASLIKQGVSSVMSAINYLSDPSNKSQPFSIKVAQVGKIITAGLVAGGAIFLGELFEKLLDQVPGMQIKLPLLGTLANVIGMFLASLVSGLVGAITINLIDKFIANKQRSDVTAQQIDAGNEALNLQRKIQAVNEAKLDHVVASTEVTIGSRHAEAANIMRDSLENIAANCKEDKSIAKTQDEIGKLFEELEDE